MKRKRAEVLDISVIPSNTVDPDVLLGLLASIWAEKEVTKPPPGTGGTRHSSCGGNDVHLGELYSAVQEHGGHGVVASAKQWNSVAAAIGIDARAATGAASHVRKLYERWILPVEDKLAATGLQNSLSGLPLDSAALLGPEAGKHQQPPLRFAAAALPAHKRAPASFMPSHCLAANDVSVLDLGPGPLEHDGDADVADVVIDATRRHVIGTGPVDVAETWGGACMRIQGAEAIQDPTQREVHRQALLKTLATPANAPAASMPAPTADQLAAYCRLIESGHEASVVRGLNPIMLLSARTAPGLLLSQTPALLPALCAVLKMYHGHLRSAAMSDDDAHWPARKVKGTLRAGGGDRTSALAWLHALRSEMSGVDPALSSLDGLAACAVAAATAINNIAQVQENVPVMAESRALHDTCQSHLALLRSEPLRPLDESARLLLNTLRICLEHMDAEAAASVALAVADVLHDTDAPLPVAVMAAQALAQALRKHSVLQPLLEDFPDVASDVHALLVCTPAEGAAAAAVCACGDFGPAAAVLVGPHPALRGAAEVEVAAYWRASAVCAGAKLAEALLAAAHESDVDVVMAAATPALRSSPSLCALVDATASQPVPDVQHHVVDTEASIDDVPHAARTPTREGAPRVARVTFEGEAPDQQGHMSMEEAAHAARLGRHKHSNGNGSRLGSPAIDAEGEGPPRSIGMPTPSRASMSSLPSLSCWVQRSMSQSVSFGGFLQAHGCGTPAAGERADSPSSVAGGNAANRGGAMFRAGSPGALASPPEATPPPAAVTMSLLATPPALVRILCEVAAGTRAGVQSVRAALRAAGVDKALAHCSDVQVSIGDVMSHAAESAQRALTTVMHWSKLTYEVVACEPLFLASLLQGQQVSHVLLPLLSRIDEAKRDMLAA